MFGKGQITLPKKFREDCATSHFIAQETPQGLLIKPFTEEVYYELDEENFGLNFPLGIPASTLLRKLKHAHGKIR